MKNVHYKSLSLSCLFTVAGAAVAAQYAGYNGAEMLPKINFYGGVAWAIAGAGSAAYAFSRIIKPQVAN